MDRIAIFEQLRAVMSEALEVPESEIKEESRFIEDLDADSLDLLELVISLKDEFHISVSDGEMKALLVELAQFLPEATEITEDSSDEEFHEVTLRLTVGSVVDFVEARVKEGVS